METSASEIRGNVPTPDREWTPIPTQDRLVALAAQIEHLSFLVEELAEMVNEKDRYLHPGVYFEALPDSLDAAEVAWQNICATREGFRRAMEAREAG